MADKKENVQLEKTMDKAEQEKLESVKKADAAVKTMQDFTSPEVLYEELIASVKKYHPSTDISMIQKAYEVAREAHKDQKRNQESRISYILFVWQSYLQILSWTKKRSLQVFFMMQLKIPG